MPSLLWRRWITFIHYAHFWPLFLPCLIWRSVIASSRCRNQVNSGAQVNLARPEFILNANTWVTAQLRTLAHSCDPLSNHSDSQSETKDVSFNTINTGAARVLVMIKLNANLEYEQAIITQKSLVKDIPLIILSSLNEWFSTERWVQW